MRILGPEQFLDMPEGTPFAYGGRWNFSGLLIKGESIRGDGYWGFWAVDPCWVEAKDSGEAFDRLDEMDRYRASYPAQTSLGKYMSYDGKSMDVFAVFDASDWAAINDSVKFT